MLNRSVIVGRMVKDCDLRYTSNGKAVGNVTVAVNRPFKTNGEQEADFINCTIWGKSAENLANYMSKGSLIGVDGRIQTRNFENQEGKKIFVTEVVADSVQFLESKKDTNGAKNESEPNVSEAKPVDIDDDSLPF